MDNVVNFRISSALKNLIGKELITDQYVAIFELVKNSFDAYSSDVKIIFENNNDINKSKIIIKDNGKGMDYDDLLNKWLFVAYSAKKDGTEDKILGNSKEHNDDIDYRKKIKSKRVFAGAKGVGRFSCDRLGEKLNLISLKQSENAVLENLIVDWSMFDENSKKEFLDIPVKHSILNENKYEIECGTVLEISQLRDEWDRNKLLKLKCSLEKLINPNQENTSNEFNIEVIVKEELENDEGQKHERARVNGYIKNTIFETLDIKTTQIISEISTNGDVITTTLKDRGNLIYTIKEKNIYKTISDIKINLFILNRTAKSNFTRLMGLEPVNYGSVFIYKNGFRVYPYGEVGEDVFNLDKRKAQGYNRFFGTRELLGRIEINGNEENLKETTSRDGGLIKNTSCDELISFFYDKAIKRLENYVFNIIKWGDPIINKETGEKQPALNPEDVKEEILEAIRKLSKSKELLSVNYDENFKTIIEEKQEKSATNVLKKLEESVRELKNPKLEKHLETTKKVFKELISTKNEAEAEADKSNEKLEKVEMELEHTTKHNLFLTTISNTDIKEVVALQHHIDRSAERINFHIDNLIEGINKSLPKDKLMNYIKKISLENEKILTVSRFVTKANFNMKAAEIEDNFVQFVNEYIKKVYLEYDYLKINGKQLNIVIEEVKELEFIIRFRPLEIIMVLDNLFSNSTKAKAKNVHIKWNKINSDVIQLIIRDDGIGIKQAEANKIFDFGFTTTDGSGIGLFHVKDIIENKMNGKVKINNQHDNGVEFILEVNK